MKIEHIAVWTRQLELMRDFYVKYFNAKAGDRYSHQHDSFASYFLSFPDGGARLEIMQMEDVAGRVNQPSTKVVGLTHLAIEVATRDDVDSLAARLQQDGFELEKQPHLTGDGYYECAVYDPDGNIVEITGG